jgi:hypothetical protein
MEIEQLIERARSTPPFSLAAPMWGVLTAANLLPALGPHSALLALFGVLIWFATAVAVFVLVTWLRKDEWFMAGFILGIPPVLARLASDLLTRSDLFATAGPMTNLLVRVVIAVPLCGGVVFGARWLTDVIGAADTATRRR